MRETTGEKEEQGNQAATLNGRLGDHEIPTGDAPHQPISKAPSLRPSSGEIRSKEMPLLGRDLWLDRGNQTLETAIAEMRGRTKARCSKATTGSRREELLGEERQVGGTPSCLSLNGARDRSDERSWSRALQMIFRRRDRIGKTAEFRQQQSQTHNALEITGDGRAERGWRPVH